MINLSLAESIAKARPTADKQVEQVLMTAESLRLQGMFMQQMIAPGMKVASLGDDDHVSILLGATTDTEITVFEKDERIISSLRQATSCWSIKHHSVVEHDLAINLPEQYSQQFDVCLSNPPYSSKNEGFGIKVWLSRSIQLLKPGGLGLLVIPIQEELPWSVRNMVIVQDYLAKLGCAIIKIEKDVHAYYEANDACLMSSNIWYRPIQAPEPVHVIGDVPEGTSLYR